AIGRILARVRKEVCDHSEDGIAVDTNQRHVVWHAYLNRSPGRIGDERDRALDERFDVGGRITHRQMAALDSAKVEEVVDEGRQTPALLKQDPGVLGALLRRDL